MPFKLQVRIVLKIIVGAHASLINNFFPAEFATYGWKQLNSIEFQTVLENSQDFRHRIWMEKLNFGVTTSA